MVFLKSTLLESEGLTHFFTTRKSGFSENEFESFNLGKNAGDDFVHVAQNRMKLSSILGTDVPVSFPNQCHSDLIDCLLEPKSENICDALVTNASQLPIAVLSADCVPVLIFDPKNRAIAAVHAGWKGTAAQILKKTLIEMSGKFGSECRDLKVAIGPCVSKQNYDVGENVYQAFSVVFSPKEMTDIFEPQNDKFLCDLKTANQLQALSCGVPFQNIDISKHCTFADHELFFSARRQGFSSGRQAAVIMLN